MADSWVSSLVARAERVDGLRQHHDLGSWNDAWCQSSVSGTVRAGDLDVAGLQDLAGSGCRVELQLEEGRLRIRAIAEGSQQFAVDASGEWADAAPDDGAASDAADAAVRNDLTTLVAALPDVTANITITLLANGAGERTWVRVADAFVHEFERVGWFAFALLLAPLPGTAKHLVVLDADDSALIASGIAVHGPSTWPAISPWTEAMSVAHQEGDPRAGAPPPTAVLPIESTGTRLVSIEAILESVAGALAWLWLADSAIVGGIDVAVRLAGNRPVEGNLRECPPGFAAPSVALWCWAAQSEQPARRQAVLQAVSLQVEQPSDLYPRATSIRETAEFLFSVSQSGLVQEALAARRGARDSAVAAGRSAADRARAASRSAVDRVLVVVAGGVGIVLANKGDLIKQPIAFGLLGLATALVLGAALLAFHVDLPGAARSVDLFKVELGRYSEVLAPRDIHAISELPSLVDGSAEVERARIAIFAIVGVAFAALLVLVALVLIQADDQSTAPSHSPTTVTAGHAVGERPPTTGTRQSSSALSRRRTESSRSLR